MLQVKLSKRPSPLELNAVKFLRDGPIISKLQSETNLSRMKKMSKLIWYHQPIQDMFKYKDMNRIRLQQQNI